MAAWELLQPEMKNGALHAAAQIVLAKWRGDPEVRRFATWAELAKALTAEVVGLRENYFFKQVGENLILDTVIFRSTVPNNSIGWSQPEFFANLGSPENDQWYTDRMSSASLADIMLTDIVRAQPALMRSLSQTLIRRAEQEYLLLNMVKGALWDAAQVADEYKVGIAVRGTGLSAHMGIESGDPTKAQEFKNKTSKEADLILCEEMDWSQIGTVVHYDPRVGWSSAEAARRADLGQSPMFPAVATLGDWERKLIAIDARVAKLGPRVKKPIDYIALKKTFDSRSAEYFEEDHEYRKGHYAPYTKLVGPYIRLKARPDLNMVGDHDLFAFTKPGAGDYGVFLRDNDPRVAMAQKALQNKPTFQAQHGGIWYWEPGTDFNVGIKRTIMGAHGPLKDEPLVYIRPGGEVTAAYYLDTDVLASVWSNPAYTLWMPKTHSGGKLLNPQPIAGA